jgi:hypothetical protein
MLDFARASSTCSCARRSSSRARHPQRQHDHHRPRRHARAGPALPAPRAGRPLRPAGLRLPALSARGQLSDIARKRLQAIFNASELGAGFQIALSDLEIRGAGNILGAEQHGHMAAVGFEMYTRLLAEAVDPGPRTCPTTTSPTRAPSSRPIGASPQSARRPTPRRCAPTSVTDTGRSRSPVEGLFTAVASGWRPRRPGCPRCGPRSGRSPEVGATDAGPPRAERGAPGRRLPPRDGVEPGPHPGLAGRDPIDVAHRALRSACIAPPPGRSSPASRRRGRWPSSACTCSSAPPVT